MASIHGGEHGGQGSAADRDGTGETADGTADQPTEVAGDTPAGGEIPRWMRAVAEVVSAPGYDRWAQQVAATGGCSAPVRLVGASQVIDAGTGEVLHVYRTADEPTGHLLVACGNRRGSVCPACAHIYQRDVFQLIRSGLAGGKSVPESVREHTRVFATLTAPSFGAVHTRRERNGKTAESRQRHGLPEPGSTAVLAQWRFAGQATPKHRKSSPVTSPNA
jgi:hypothetical protein